MPWHVEIPAIQPVPGIPAITPRSPLEALAPADPAVAGAWPDPAVHPGRPAPEIFHAAVQEQAGPYAPSSTAPSSSGGRCRKCRPHFRRRVRGPRVAPRRRHRTAGLRVPPPQVRAGRRMRQPPAQEWPAHGAAELASTADGPGHQVPRRPRRTGRRQTLRGRPGGRRNRRRRRTHGIPHPWPAPPPP